MGYIIKYTRQTKKDARLLEQAGLDVIAVKLLSVLKNGKHRFIIMVSNDYFDRIGRWET
jgi:hypothetical protein